MNESLPTMVVYSHGATPISGLEVVPAEGKQVALVTDKEAIVPAYLTSSSADAAALNSSARWSGKIRIIAATVTLLVVALIIGLGVGLGVGLSRHHMPLDVLSPTQNNTSISASTSSTAAPATTSAAQGIRSDSSIAALVYNASQAASLANNIYVYYQDTDGYIIETSRSFSSPQNWATPIKLVKAIAKTPLAASIWGNSSRSFFYLDANNTLCEYFWDQVWSHKNILQQSITVHPSSQLTAYLSKDYPGLPQLILYQGTGGDISFLSWSNDNNNWQTGSLGSNIDALVGTGLSVVPYKESASAMTQLQLFYQKISLSLSIKTWNSGVWGTDDTELELVSPAAPLSASFYFSGSGNPVINVMYPSDLEHVVIDYQIPGDGWDTGGEFNLTINQNSSIGLISSEQLYALVGREIQEYSLQPNGSWMLTSVVKTDF